jgi:type I restriction enzyme R subunit
MKPEDRARVDIDRQLTQAGWVVQDADKTDLHAGRGVAIREFPLARGHGKADYLLYVDRKAVGAVEAKKQGTTLTGVEIQSAKYSEGLPANLPAVLRPLPFLYEGTGVETRFTNLLDPDARSRPVFHYRRRLWHGSITCR